MIDDIFFSFRKYRIWSFLSYQEIKSRYVGSYIGPFWITITQIILVISIGYIYGGMFNIPPEKYMPFLTCGFVYWNLITGIINEGTRVYGSNKGYLSEINLNPVIFIFKNVFSNTIIFFHNFIAVFVIFYLTDYDYTYLFFLSIIGFFFIVVNGFFLIISIGIICERFRDIPSLITNILQISFFVTPIIWDPMNFKSRAIIILKLNPFWHFIEAARAPLLGRTVEIETYLILLIITFFNFLLALFMYKKFSKKIIYWMQ
tara:strand:- start:13498 stop:14274 length:777 start_codon:yes stop_codon:yes gene_type:complete